MLADVYEAYRADPAFDHLRAPGIVLVAGEGSSRPKVLIVGSAPGATENTARRPFVGASGMVLRSLINDCAQLESQDYFLTTTIKYRTPGGRVPTRSEIEASVPYLRCEWSALGGPGIIVAVGEIALTALKRPHSKLGSLSHAGKPYAIGGGKALWPMIPPSFGVQHANAQPQMEAHWKALGDYVREEFG
jgi:uracil-DNA glycosylase family 4